jgi:hypothetical protein
MVGLGGIEPPTSALSVLRSNRLSYSPSNKKAASDLDFLTALLRRPPLEAVPAGAL